VGLQTASKNRPEQQRSKHIDQSSIEKLRELRTEARPTAVGEKKRAEKMGATRAGGKKRPFVDASKTGCSLTNSQNSGRKEKAENFEVKKEKKPHREKYLSPGEIKL